MMATISHVIVDDIRFPTSSTLDGSDAMNPDPDYSAAYVQLLCGAGGPTGHGFAFTIGRGNEVVCSAIRSVGESLIGRPAPDNPEVLAELYFDLINDSQLRWLGPEKGVIHMAIGAVVNASWDFAAKQAGLPLWRYLATFSPAQLVQQIDFRYITDALTPDQALAIFQASAPGRDDRAADLVRHGYPAYTTSPGWLGFEDSKLAVLAQEAVSAGFTQIKLKVGANLSDDLRRLAVARDAVGPGIQIAVDANQRWDVDVAIEWINAFAPYNPAWIEEPTAPDDVLAHAAIAQRVQPVRIATGEHAQNRVLVKQLLQAKAASVIQMDATRVAGVNENLAILALCAKFRVPVCPHAGGVGLCELVQHLAYFDYVGVSATREERLIEYVDHLHDHFVDPVIIRDGRYVPSDQPGFSAEIRASSRSAFAYPNGSEWANA
jgi:L-fuconate dehydratase